MLHFLENLRVSNDSKNCDVDGHPIHGKALNKFIFWNEDEIFWCRNVSRKWEKQALAAENNLVESEKLMQKIERHIQLSDPLVSTSSFLQILMDDLEEVGVRLNENKFNKLIQLYMNINNQSRLWCNCGWSPEELAAMAHSAPISIAFGPGLQNVLAYGDIGKSEF